MSESKVPIVFLTIRKANTDAFTLVYKLICCSDRLGLSLHEPQERRGLSGQSLSYPSKHLDGLRISIEMRLVDMSLLQSMRDSSCLSPILTMHPEVHHLTTMSMVNHPSRRAAG